jgi:hypothetical protein
MATESRALEVIENARQEQQVSALLRAQVALGLVERRRISDELRENVARAREALDAAQERARRHGVI